MAFNCASYGHTNIWTVRSILDLGDNMLDEYLELCQKGLLRREMVQNSGRNGRIYRG